jgi:hypothetical protein
MGGILDFGVKKFSTHGTDFKDCHFSLGYDFRVDRVCGLAVF